MSIVSTDMQPHGGVPWDQTIATSTTASASASASAVSPKNGVGSRMMVDSDSRQVDNRQGQGADDGAMASGNSNVHTRLTSADRPASEPGVSSPGFSFFFPATGTTGTTGSGDSTSQARDSTSRSGTTSTNSTENNVHSIDVSVGVKRLFVNNSTLLVPEPLDVGGDTEDERASEHPQHPQEHPQLQQHQQEQEPHSNGTSKKHVERHQSSCSTSASISISISQPTLLPGNSSRDNLIRAPRDDLSWSSERHYAKSSLEAASIPLNALNAKSSLAESPELEHHKTREGESSFVPEETSTTIVSDLKRTPIAGAGALGDINDDDVNVNNNNNNETGMGYSYATSNTNSNRPTAWSTVARASYSVSVPNSVNPNANVDSTNSPSTSDKMNMNAAENQRDRDDDDSTLRSLDSRTGTHTATSSPVITSYPQGIPVLQQLQLGQREHAATGSHSVVGTPSTVSTAPSTDGEASLAQGMDPNAMERLALKMDAAYREGTRYHRRVPSWEASPQHFSVSDVDHAFSHNSNLAPAYAPLPAPSAWTGVPSGQQQQQQQQQRVASFRTEREGDPHAMYALSRMSPPTSGGDARWQQQQQQQQQQQPPSQARFTDPQLPFLANGPVDNRMFHQPPNIFNPYQQQQQQQQQLLQQQLLQQQLQQQQQQQRKPTGYTQPLLPPSAATPPRGVRGQRLAQSPHRPPTQPQTPQGASVGGGGGGGGGQSHNAAASPGSSRSASEVLKTLLRKKACLYEPDTSRAVALVTWLVGRELAMEFGFFSRQQLQAGVHTCVADKIESGAITRTKVNRCMQIILNSCFHYIIPRPDGSEENGSSFRNIFVEEVQDDAFLLEVLPAPWNDLTVDREAILEASAAEMEVKVAKKPSPANTPKNSPSLGPVDRGSPGKDSIDGESGDHKRAVLLCFNENVRCAEDVFRSHNEFIRDTAHASHLQMSSQEWRLFFGQAAAGARFIWGNVGIPVPHSESRGGPMQTDALGMMTDDEAGKFRTCWCTKRYEHSRELCGFAHAEINGGWIRRNPSIHIYRAEMCSFVSKMADKRIGSFMFVLNECPHGVNCEYAHSMEEIVYHPKNYKAMPCSSLARQAGCNLGDVCPHFHPADSYRFSKKSDGRGYGARHSKQPHHGVGGKGVPLALPVGSPILYASPAPVSSFEQHFALPGLQNLFRRHCSVVRAHLRTPGGTSCTCCYSYFGDDSGVNIDPTNRSNPVVGLPQPIRA